MLDPRFITTQKVTLVADGEPKCFSVLVFDDDGYIAYKKKIASFQYTIADLPEGTKGGWEISKSFMDDAVSDLITAEYNYVQELFNEKGLEPPEFEPAILGYPVVFNPSEVPTCRFIADCGVYENNHWK